MAIVRTNKTFDQGRAITEKVTATTDPAVTDDYRFGYEPGTQWVNTASGDIFICQSNAAGAAVWVPNAA